MVLGEAVLRTELLLTGLGTMISLCARVYRRGYVLTSQRMGENRTLPHFGRAQVGVPDFAFLPVMTEHSLLM